MEIIQILNDLQVVVAVKDWATGLEIVNQALPLATTGEEKGLIESIKGLIDLAIAFGL